jgi:nitrous oxidase accessory protein
MKTKIKPTSTIIGLLVSLLSLIPLSSLSVSGANHNEGYIYINNNTERLFVKISDAINAAESGDTVFIRGGVHHEHLSIVNKSVSIIGIGMPTIDGDGSGTIITIKNTGNLIISGLRIINSGRNYGSEDSGIKIINSDNIWITNNLLDKVFFGILIKNSYNIWVLENNITGIVEYPIPGREHGVYAWYSFYVNIINNTFRSILDGSYNDHSYNLVIRNNRIEDARYGVHLMYCENVTIVENHITKSIAGLSLMYSRNIVASSNLIIRNRVAGIGEGIFIPESDNVTVERNLIVANIIGINIRHIPFTPKSKAIIKDNVIAFNYVGITTDGESRALIYGNSFIENIMDVSLVGVENNNVWFNNDTRTGNFWSNYRKTGSKPFISEDPLEDLLDGYPQLRIFMYSPSYLILEAMKEAFPVNPRIKAFDLYPLERIPYEEYFKNSFHTSNIVYSILLTTPPILVIVYVRRRIGR